MAAKLARRSTATGRSLTEADYHKRVVSWLASLGGLIALTDLATAFARRKAAAYLKSIAPKLFEAHQVPLLELAPVFRRSLLMEAKALGIPEIKEAAEAWMKMYGLNRAKDLDKTTVRGLRQLLRDALDQELPPREAARLIEDRIGLTQRQVISIRNREATLRESGLSPAQVRRRIEQQIAAYREQRALAISRTEYNAAIQHGKLAAWREAQRRKKLPETAVKVWITAGDEMTCPICRALAGERQPLDQPFSIGVMAPPAHVSCRCMIEVRRG